MVLASLKKNKLFNRLFLNSHNNGHPVLYCCASAWTKIIDDHNIMWDKLKEESLNKLNEHLGFEFDTILGTFHNNSPKNAALWLIDNYKEKNK